MSTAPDASPRRSARIAAESNPKRPRATRSRSANGPSPQGPSQSGRSSKGAARSLAGRIDWYGWGSIAIPIVALPVSFFVWYMIISLGSYPNDQRIGDLIVGLLLTAAYHAVILVGILFAIVSIRAARRAKRWGVLGWIGVVLGVLVIIYWELLVSPWLVDLWNKATGAA
ncbi:hypothetical protein HQQ80_15010 [Microbacteriaceae bacterium VKM Ac-2855]|nr:hypothetical protein [Microbacteriaceae bacterium VKM Ac-2855]